MKVKKCWVMIIVGTLFLFAASFLMIFALVSINPSKEMLVVIAKVSEPSPPPTWGILFVIIASIVFAIIGVGTIITGGSNLTPKDEQVKNAIQYEAKKMIKTILDTI